MNALGRSARGALILLVALVIGVWVISQTNSNPTAEASNGVGGSANPTDTTIPVATTTTTLQPPRDPKTVRVLMVNGTTTSGIARVAGKCVEKFDVLPPKNAVTKPVAASVLYAQPAFMAEAAEVAASLGYQAVAIQFPAEPGVKEYPTPPPDIMLIVGDDLAPGIRNRPCAVDPS
jgi:hypothetical protein